MPVYFIQAGEGGPVKIGHSSNPQARLAGLQVGHSSDLRMIRAFEGGEPEERALHARFAAHRMIGEWFHPVAEITAGSIALAPWRAPVPQRRTRLGWTNQSRRQAAAAHQLRWADPVWAAGKRASSRKTGAMMSLQSQIAAVHRAVYFLRIAALCDDEAGICLSFRDLRRAYERLAAIHVEHPDLFAWIKQSTSNSAKHAFKTVSQFHDHPDFPRPDVFPAPAEAR